MVGCFAISACNRMCVMVRHVCMYVCVCVCVCVCVQGEGVGGSLATVLGLMAASRGLRPHCMLPLVVAFDAPPVLAEVVSGALWGCGGAQQDECDSTVRTHTHRQTEAWHTHTDGQTHAHSLGPELSASAVQHCVCLCVCVCVCVSHRTGLRWSRT